MSFASGTSIASIATAINAITVATGVSASVNAGTLKFDSTDYGSSAFVSVKTIAGKFATDNNVTKDSGVDAQVTVNGAAAQADGASVSYRSSDLDLSFDLDKTFNKPGTGTFEITGGGATFSLGAKVTENDKASLGIQSVSTGSLGNNSLGYLSSLGSGQADNLSSGNLVNAQKIVDLAVKQVSELRGRLAHSRSSPSAARRTLWAWRTKMPHPPSVRLRIPTSLQKLRISPERRFCRNRQPPFFLRRTRPLNPPLPYCEAKAVLHENRVGLSESDRSHKPINTLEPKGSRVFF